MIYKLAPCTKSGKPIRGFCNCVVSSHDELLKLLRSWKSAGLRYWKNLCNNEINSLV